MFGIVMDRLRSIMAEGQGIERRTAALVEGFFGRMKEVAAAERRGEAPPPVLPGARKGWKWRAEGVCVCWAEGRGMAPCARAPAGVA